MSAEGACSARLMRHTTSRQKVESGSEVLRGVCSRASPSPLSQRDIPVPEPNKSVIKIKTFKTASKPLLLKPLLIVTQSRPNHNLGRKDAREDAGSGLQVPVTSGTSLSHTNTAAFGTM